VCKNGTSRLTTTPGTATPPYLFLHSEVPKPSFSTTRIILLWSQNRTSITKTKPKHNLQKMTSTKTNPYNPSTSSDQQYGTNVYSSSTGQPIHSSNNAVPIYYDPNDFQQSSNYANSGTSATSQHIPSSTVVVQEPATYSVVENPRYVDIGSRKPVVLTYCPRCAKEHVTTHTRTKSTGTTWLCVVAGVFIFWPLCWLPLAIRPLKQTNHYCDSCGNKVGRVKPCQ
jgi:predicted RNA-binding Zn-ribbon protein involved in translation (DUF1610 family)